jgi:vacuolar-type H+-ATPase subunit F/Vma7
VPAGQIVVIGDEDAVFGLGLLGLKGYVASSPDQVQQALRDAAADPATALILLTENWLELLPPPSGGTGPLVIEIPSTHAVSKPLEMQRRIERALGVRLED